MLTATARWGVELRVGESAEVIRFLQLRAEGKSEREIKKRPRSRSPGESGRSSHMERGGDGGGARGAAEARGIGAGGRRMEEWDVVGVRDSSKSSSRLERGGGRDDAHEKRDEKRRCVEGGSRHGEAGRASVGGGSEHPSRSEDRSQRDGPGRGGAGRGDHRGRALDDRAHAASGKSSGEREAEQALEQARKQGFLLNPRQLTALLSNCRDLRQLRRLAFDDGQVQEFNDVHCMAALRM